MELFMGPCKTTVSSFELLSPCDNERAVIFQEVCCPCKAYQRGHKNKSKLNLEKYDHKNKITFIIEYLI